MRPRRALIITLVIAALSIPVGAIAPPAEPDPGDSYIRIEADGLVQSVRVRKDEWGIPHVFALNDHDALFMMGYFHAQDRLFQMDVSRHTFSGTLAELLGPAALPQDVQLRTLGLRRAAEASLAVQSPELMEWLEAYSEGVNSYLRSTEMVLPDEYAALELTAESIAPWTPTDCLTIAKGLAFGLDFDLSDIDLTQSALVASAAGQALGFDGLALFQEDLFRSAPFDPTVSIPGFLDAKSHAVEVPLRPDLDKASYLGPRTARLIDSYRNRVAGQPVLEKAFAKRDHFEGSNWWMFSSQHTADGHPLLANDPHLALNTPATFYEIQIRVAGGGEDPPMNVTGVTFPGGPSLVQGCNIFVCWGSTVNPLDVTDVYQESLVIDPQSGLPAATMYQGNPEPLTFIPQTFLVNGIGDGVPNTIGPAPIGPLEGGVTLVVPRRNHGPIVDFDASDPLNVIGLSVQYTGWSATREFDAFRLFARAHSIEEFGEAARFFDNGSQNWAVVDAAGHVGYFTGAEMPLREDLQTLMAPDGGIPPWLIRDGSGGLAHEWMPATEPDPTRSLPYAILPFEEMPTDRDPERGYILNCNNDPVGTTIDNNPLNQLRPGGGLYYLSPGYASGFREGRLQRLVDAHLATGQPVGLAELMEWQSNHQLLDAEVLAPYLIAAFDHAADAGAPAPLAALAADAEVAEAIERLRTWDFSTPTGLPEGYDPGDDATDLQPPTKGEIADSIAASIYSVWRGQAVSAVIDRTVDSIGMGGFGPGSALAMSALRNLLDNFAIQQGVGASGVDFFDHPDLDDPGNERDAILLGALREALDLMAGDNFEQAFGRSTDQADYRWGRLHRIVFDHPLGGSFNLPPGVFLQSPAGLDGVARSGGFGALDASSHSARADGANEFMFGSGPNRRFVGSMQPDGPMAYQVIPGGQNGRTRMINHSDQLRLWLVNDYHSFLLTPAEVAAGTSGPDVFLPPAP